RLPGLAHLESVRLPARVDDRPAGADRRAELRRQVVDQLEVLGRTQAAAAADDDRGVVQARTLGLFLLALENPGRRAAGVDGIGQGLHPGGGTLQRLSGEGFGP